MSQMKNARLSEEELELLTDALEVYGSENGMNLEAVDGLFCALISGPSLVPFDEYLRAIFGGEPKFDDEAKARDTCYFLIRHWNAVVSELEATSVGGNLYEPIMGTDENGLALGNDWASGYLYGMQMRVDDWAELLEDDTPQGMLLPMTYLKFEDDPDPQLRAPSLTTEQREEMIGMMMARVVQIYHHFAPHRRATAPHAATTIRRQGSKVGRNQACPCGSGKKFKACCGV
jgi:uncharacterized protein